MPPADAVLLPLCIGLSLIGLFVVIVAWRRGRRGRMLQGLAIALAPVGLYFSGLLRLVWDAVVAVVAWASRVVFSIPVWVGLSVLALCVVLWVVGGVLARRRTRAVARDAGRQEAPAVTRGSAGRTTAAATTTRAPAGRAPAKNAPAQDDDMAEIEALLKSRGIE